MICPKGHYMPDTALTCPTCAAKNGDVAFQKLQLEFLRKVARGEFHDGLRIAKGLQRHVLMYSSYTRTFCGKELENKPAIQYQPYDDYVLAGVCAECRSAIRSAMEEATAP